MRPPALPDEAVKALRHFKTQAQARQVFLDFFQRRVGNAQADSALAGDGVFLEDPQQRRHDLLAVHAGNLDHGGVVVQGRAEGFAATQQPVQPQFFPFLGDTGPALIVVGWRAPEVGPQAAFQQVHAVEGEAAHALPVEGHGEVLALHHAAFMSLFQGQAVPGQADGGFGVPQRQGDLILGNHMPGLGPGGVFIQNKGEV